MCYIINISPCIEAGARCALCTRPPFYLSLGSRCHNFPHPAAQVVVNSTTGMTTVTYCHTAATFSSNCMTDLNIQYKSGGNRTPIFDNMTITLYGYFLYKEIAIQDPVIKILIIQNPQTKSWAAVEFKQHNHVEERLERNL